MGNWLGMVELQRGMRNSFLINRKPTETEIYRTKSLFKQIEGAIATIEPLASELKFPRPKSRTKYRIEETVRLLFISESLDEIMGDNKVLKEQFILGLGKIRSHVDMALEMIINLLSGGNNGCY